MAPAQKKIVAALGFCGLASAADNWFVSPAPEFELLFDGFRVRRGNRRAGLC